MTDTKEKNGDKEASPAEYSAGVVAAAEVNARTAVSKGTNGHLAPNRFGGFASAVDHSISSSVQVHKVHHHYNVTAEELGVLSDQRTRVALADILETAVNRHMTSQGDDDDEEAPPVNAVIKADVLKLADRLKELDANGPFPEHSEEAVQEDKTAEVAANALATVLLSSSPEYGISENEVESRRAVFGTNAIADKQLESFCKLCWEAVQDFVLIMLIVLGVISIVVEISTYRRAGKKCGACWIEGAAILVSVVIVVLVTAGIDYAKQFAFIKLIKNLHETNTKAVIRDGRQVSVTDDDIVVGDILSVNSHNLASIPADCVLLGPSNDLRMDESALTGESKLIIKKPGDVVLSGTTALQGSGKMVVIAVGIHSVAGKIKAQVYESEDYDDSLGEKEESPLFVKLDTLAKHIGLNGMFCAIVAFVASCILGLAVKGEDVSRIIDYLIVSITVLAVAVPEGLPLAVTLALAFSSNKMTKDQNLVKHLDACETMGCATTICTDKTGTSHLEVWWFGSENVDLAPLTRSPLP